MAGLSGFPQAFTGDTSASDTTQKHTLGFLAADASGNLYKYVSFGAAAVNGEVVAFDGTYTTSRLTNTSRGFVGIALATQTSSTFGWVQVYGVNSFVWADTGVTTADPLIAAATTDLGHVAAATSGDTNVGIFNMKFTTPPDSCASTALGTSAVSAPGTAILAFPFITGQFCVTS